MKTYIIAEAGVNHNGDINLAKKLIDEAKKTGVDCIKFQTFISQNLVSESAFKADYQKKHTNKNETQLDMLKKLELSFAEFCELNNYCKNKNIEFLSTAFDLESIEFLARLNMKRWKIPSGEINNLPYLIKIAKLNKPIIMSTGMSTIEEIREAVNILKENGSKNISLLHCTTEYPTPYRDVNLRAMKKMKYEFKLPVGYSDHTEGITIPIAAVAMGAIIIEKHFTLDRNMKGPDHKASLEPHELRKMVNSIRNLEIALGDGEKKPVKSEIKNIKIARKSIVAKRNILKDEILTEENITVKRPGNGISPMKWFEVIGLKSPKDFKKDELIEIPKSQQNFKKR